MGAIRVRIVLLEVGFVLQTDCLTLVSGVAP
jgi:hypothetical protein